MSEMTFETALDVMRVYMDGAPIKSDATEAWSVIYAHLRGGVVTDAEYAKGYRNLVYADLQFEHKGETDLSWPEMSRLIDRGWMAEGEENGEYYVTEEGDAVMRSALTAAQPARGVDSPIDDLVNRFAEALREKLHKAEKKYGYSNAWMRDDWRDTLVNCMHEHIAKGDPRDVAAYCAFAWHHGWSLEAISSAPPAGFVVPDGWMLFPESAWNFLWGTEPLDGIHFGDFHPNRVGLFWWRHVIKEMIAASQAHASHGERGNGNG